MWSSSSSYRCPCLSSEFHAVCSGSGVTRGGCMYLVHIQTYVYFHIRVCSLDMHVRFGIYLSVSRRFALRISVLHGRSWVVHRQVCKIYFFLLGASLLRSIADESCTCRDRRLMLLCVSSPALARVRVPGGVGLRQLLRRTLSRMCGV